MPGMSDYLENEILDHVLNNEALTSPTTVYVALFTDSASESEIEGGTLTNEVDGGSYERQTVAFGTPSGGAVANTGAVTFTDMPAGTVGFAAIMDASTAGNVLFSGALVDDKTLNSGDTFTLAIGDIDVTVS